MKLEQLFTPHTRINSKWIKDLNVRPETIKIVEENTGSKILDITHTIFYQIYLPRQGKQKKKINKWNHITLKSFCTVKENINKIKRQPTEWENIYTNISGKGLITKIFKALIKLNIKKQSSVFQNVGIKNNGN